MIRGEKYKVFRVPAEKLLPNPAQPRERFEEEGIRELAESIRENGLIQPITVRKSEAGQYEIVAGERRFRAAIEAGLTALPCILSDCTPEQAAVLAVVENIQRRDLDCFEEAAAIKALMERTGTTQESLARKLGKSQSSVANKLRLLRLTPREVQIIRSAGLTERHARALLRMPGGEAREKALEMIAARNCNVEQAEKLIEKLMAEAGEKAKRRKRRFVLKDIRLFFNTLEKAVDTVRLSGLEAELIRRETEEYIECIVTIPKNKRDKVEKA